MIQYVFKKPKGGPHVFLGTRVGAPSDVLSEIVEGGHYSEIQEIMYDNSDTMYFCMTEAQSLSIPELRSSMQDSEVGRAIINHLSSHSND